MKLGIIFKVSVLSLILSIGGRFVYLEFQSSMKAKSTEELCAAIGNFLEVGSLREAFEGLQYGVARSGNGEACVNVIDNGRSYAPDCTDTNQNYQTVVCKAQSNVGVRAQVMYPTEPIFSSDLVLWWAWVTLVMMLFMWVLRNLAGYFSRQVLAELQARIQDVEMPANRSMLGKSIAWTLDQGGVLGGLKVQATELSSRLRVYEEKLVSDSKLRAQQEIEIAKAQEYLEKVRKIRHDVRSPLSALFAVHHALKSEDELLVSTLSAAAHSIRTLVDNLGNLEREELLPQLTLVEVTAEQSVQSFRLRLSEQKKVSVSVEYDIEKLCPVLVVKDGLLRIFDNLLENAFDAVALGGSIQIRISSNASTCQIMVSDNGCGVPEAIKNRLFCEGATFGKLGGTGLGLFHAKRNIESWGGEINLVPADQGTHFLIKIPLLQTGVCFKALPLHRDLLIIDSDKSFPGALIRAGFQVLDTADSFTSGKELLQIRQSQGISALVEQRLSSGDLGTDLISKAFCGRDIYLCTNGYDEPGVVRKAKEIGVAIIPKSLLLIPRSNIDSKQPDYIPNLAFEIQGSMTH